MTRVRETLQKNKRCKHFVRTAQSGMVILPGVLRSIFTRRVSEKCSRIKYDLEKAVATRHGFFFGLNFSITTMKNVIVQMNQLQQANAQWWYFNFYYFFYFYENRLARADVA